MSSRPTRSRTRRHQERTVYRVKVFSDDPTAGNLAGVVLDGTDLSDATMGRIAARIDASETAFLFCSPGTGTRIRWFSATHEIGCCVHATLAAVGLLQDLGRLTPGTLTLESRTGTISAFVASHKAFADVGPFGTLRRHPKGVVARCLGIPPSAIVGRPKVVDISGEKELVVELQAVKLLSALAPDVSTYSQLSRTASAQGVSVFARMSTRGGIRIQAREFAPLYGYLEDPICGFAAGAIAAYLQHDAGLPAVISVEQGMFTGTRGVVEARLRGRSIRIGGYYLVCGRQRIKF